VLKGGIGAADGNVGMRRLAVLIITTGALFAGLLSAPSSTQSPAEAMAIAQPGLGAARPQPARIPQPSAAARRQRATRFLLVDAAGADVRAWPAGRSIGSLAETTPLGSHTWAWAVATTRDGRWARIVLPWRPNGTYGWVRMAGRTVVHTRVWVEADLSRRIVKLQSGAGTLRTFSAAVGAASTPTPTGRFSVTDLVATGDPSGPFGWYAFGLSGHQPNLPAGWSGGDQLAIHGTNAPSSIGTAASAGCLRVSATALGVLKRYLRLGTPVVIHP
jgi:lipoprotein-anchoring transpeptidase ErfK/SrfK